MTSLSDESGDRIYRVPCGSHRVTQTSSHGPLCSCCSGSGVVAIAVTDEMIDRAYRRLSGWGAETTKDQIKAVLYCALDGAS